jgi:protein-tyrosine phosphatase
MNMQVNILSSLHRYFHRTTEFIDKAVSSGGLVVVNCVMGWSR